MAELRAQITGVRGMPGKAEAGDMKQRVNSFIYLKTTTLLLSAIGIDSPGTGS